MHTVGESSVLSPPLLGPALLPQSLQGRFPCENSEGPRAHEKVVWKGLILKGEKRTDLPIVQPNKFEFVPVDSNRVLTQSGPLRVDASSQTIPPISNVMHRAYGGAMWYPPPQGTRSCGHGGNMRRREFIMMLGGPATSWPLAARAQQAVRPLIGLLSPLSAVGAGHVSAFRSALRDLGYVEGRNMTLVLRYGDGVAERMPSLARELVALNSDLTM